VTPDDLTQERGGLNEGILVQLKDTAPEGMLPDAWAGADVKAPIGTHNGSENSLLYVSLAPGGALEDHALANAEAIYYVASGNGTASDASGASDIGEDSFVFVPRGERHAIRNSDDTTLELYVVLTGAGSLSAAA
jgi:mannose-6-phosphate isomerase-like protein (cupin superfamily)